MSYNYRMSILQILQEKNYISDSMSINSSSDSEENTPPNRQKFVGAQMYKSLRRPTVRDILKENEQGRIILRSYSQCKTLSKYSRHVIVELLVSHLINNIKG